jgi:signal peptide peptidase SppA
MKKSSEILILNEQFVDLYQTALNRVSCLEISSLSETSRDPIYQPYEVKNGVLKIPVSGMLLNRMNITVDGLFTSYDYIVEAFMEGMNDPKVKEVVLDINSPGGVVQGAFEAVALMVSSKTKPVTAQTKGYATSGAYMMASVADTIVAQPSAVVGSIGAIVIHQSFEKALEQEGVTVTVMKSGKRKAEGNPYEALSDDTKQKMQEDIDRIGKQFAQLIASRRPNMTVEDVINLEAASFTGEEGKELGLVDKISLVNERINGYNNKNVNKETTMTDSAQKPEIDIAKVQKDAAIAAQGRIQAIIESSEAEGREDLAKTIAFTTDLTAEQAVALLKQAPKVAEKESFEKLMLSTKNPDAGVGADVPAAEKKADHTIWGPILNITPRKGE